VRGPGMPVKPKPKQGKTSLFGSEDKGQDIDVPDEEKPKDNGGKLSRFGGGSLSFDMDVPDEEDSNFGTQRLPKTDNPELVLQKLQNQLFGEKIVPVAAEGFPIAGSYRNIPQLSSHVGNGQCDTQNIETITKMVLGLQVDLQFERTRREILEEKVQKLENNSTSPSKKRPENNSGQTRNSIETDWNQSEINELNGLDSQKIFKGVDNQIMIKSIHEKMGEFRSEFDYKLRSLN
jgi:hypothetical protein